MAAQAASARLAVAHSVPYRVRFDECGPEGVVRASALLRFIQDAAWVHSDAAGFGRAWYAERRLTWLIRAQVLDVLAAATYGDNLVVTTEVVGWRRMWARRRTTLTGIEGEPRAVALTDWVILGATGAPVRVPDEIRDATGDMPAFVPTRLRDAAPPDSGLATARRVRTSDLDPMGHVNNAVYVDYLEGGIAREGDAAAIARIPRRYTAEYIGSAEPDDDVRDAAWRHGRGWAYALIDSARGELFRGRLDPL